MSTMNILYDGKVYTVTEEKLKEFVNTKLDRLHRERFNSAMKICIIEESVSVNKSKTSGSQTPIEAKAENNLEEAKARKRDAQVNTDLEKRYETSNYNTTRHGFEHVYDTTNFPDTSYEDLAVADEIAQFDKNNIHIGSIIPHIGKHGLDTTDVIFEGNDCSTTHKKLNLNIPNICIPDTLKKLVDDLIANEKVTTKTIEDIARIADEIDNIPEARQLIEILSQNYLKIPQQIKSQLPSPVLEAIYSYMVRNTPEKEPEYEDLSAYLNAPFPELNIEPEKENDELDKILKKLDDLNLEVEDIPIVKVCPDSLTERRVDGNGAFDRIASSIFNQLTYARDNRLITHDEIGTIYSQIMMEGMNVAANFELGRAQVEQQSYANRVNAVQAGVAVLQAKAQLLTLPIQIRLMYAQLQAQLKQLDLIKVQVEIEKAKYPQIIAQTDLILAQTDSQRLTNEQLQVAIQQGKLQLEQSKEQIALMEEQNKQARVQTQVMERQLETTVLQNNKLLEETKLMDAQTQYQLKQVMLADVQKVKAKAEIKAMAQQLEKEKQNIALIKAQVAATYAQLSMIQEQIKTSKAQYSDTIDGHKIGGVLGAQIDVNKAQAVGFERKAFNDLLSLAQSGWSAKKTADIATLSPNAFTALGVDRLFNWYSQKYFNLPNDVYKLPKNYSDYLTDDQMDGYESSNADSNSVKEKKVK